MKVNQLKIGSMLSYLQMAISIIIGLTYTPVMLRLLGQSEYGLYNTVASTISMLSLLSLGFNGSYIRYYSKYKINNDEESISRLNGLFLKIFLIIGTISLVCGLFLSFNLNLVFDKGLTQTEYQTAKILMLLLTLSLTVSFPMSVFTSIISAHERFLFLKMLGMLRTVVSPLVTLPILLVGYRSVGMVVVTVSIALLTDIVYLCYAKCILKIKISFKKTEKGLFRDVFVFTFFLALNVIIDQVNNNIDKLLIGRFRGTVQVAIYSVGATFYQYYMLFSTSISSVFTPKIHRIINNTFDNKVEQTKQLTDIFTRVGRIQYVILSLIATGFVFFGKEFISIWAGDGYENSYFVGLMLIVSVTVPLIQNLGIEVQRAQNNHRFRSIVYSIMALINLMLTVILCKHYGVVGATVGTVISFVLANGLIMNIYYHKKCNIDIVFFWKNILRMSLGMIFPVSCAIFMKIIFTHNSTSVLFAEIVIYILVYCLSVWFISLNRYEKDLLLNPLKQFIKSLKKRDIR